MLSIRDKKILITGAAGFLGSFIIDELVGRGYADLIKKPTSSEFDLTTASGCRDAVSGCSLVIHAAAVTGNGAFHRKSPGDIFFKNLIMGAQLIESARLEGVSRMVTIGSVTEYPETAAILKEESLWDGYPNPANAPYAIAKRLLVAQASAYRDQYGMNFTHAIIPNLYGPRFSLDPDREYVIPAFIRKIYEAKESGSETLMMGGGGDVVREFLYVADAAHMIVDILLSDTMPDVLNIGSGVGTSLKSLADEIKKISGFSGELVWEKESAKDSRILDLTRAAALGLNSKTSFNQGLHEVIQWYNSRTWNRS